MGMEQVWILPAIPVAVFAVGSNPSSPIGVSYLTLGAGSPFEGSGQLNRVDGGHIGE